MTHPQRPTLSWMLGSIHRVIGLGFGSGLAPIAPGTAGTLFAWGLYTLLSAALSPVALFTLLGFGLLYGVWACGQCSRDLGRPDDGSIVWDEVIAFGWILFLIGTNHFWIQVLAFLIFRFFDAAKPWPIHHVDRFFKQGFIHPENPNGYQIVKQGFGIMIDDLMAALFTLIIMTLGMRWLL